MTDRYDTSGNPESQYQPGSEDRVLLNKMGISDPEEMDDVELALLQDLQAKLLEDVESDQRIIPFLDFTRLSEHEGEYISAIHQGQAGNYEPMKRVFSEVLKASMSEV